jgi:DNA-directed RNA polymerase specialized sigma24 family protein
VTGYSLQRELSRCQTLARRSATRPALADDLAQEALIAAWRAWVRTGDAGHAWQAAVYRVRGLLYAPMPHRQLGGQSIRHDRAHARLEDAAGVADPAGEDAMQHVELVEDLRRALDTLPPHLLRYAKRRYFAEGGRLGPINHRYEADLLERLRARLQTE